MTASFRPAITLVLPILLGFASPLPAQPEGDDLILRVYDVSDLVRTAPDRPYRSGLPTIDNFATPMPASGGGSGGAGGGLGGGSFGGAGMGGGGFFQVGPGESPGGFGPAPSLSDGSTASTRFTIHDLRSAITNTVAPQSWIELGGEGICSALGTLLLIRQTAAAHEEVTALLKSIGEQGGKRRTVTVEAFWLSMDDQTRGQVRSAIERAQTDQERRPALLADLRQLAEFHAGITCFTDQTVHLTSGERRAIVTSVVPVASAYAVGYQPVIACPNVGALLQVTPSLDGPGTTATLDLTSTVTAWNEPGEPFKLVARVPDAQPTEDRAGTVVAALERVNLTTQHLATTTRVAIGVPTLVGGLATTTPPANDSADPVRTLELVVCVTLPEP